MDKLKIFSTFITQSSHKNPEENASSILKE